ncbi:diguanylate cyclase [Celerinatantimonas sp. YJH-8]|uniref:sensor domain-containing diguanylate cyclase n=1 Tax=Celerinatantimonas sp. YJH-8 TaxID=3228714 RepID=UPI0038C0C6F1
MPIRSMQFWQLRSYKLWLMCTLLFVAFFTVSWLAYQVAHDSLNEQIEEQSLPLTSDNIYSQIQQDLLRPIFIASLMSHDTFVKDWALQPHHDQAAMVRYLTAIQHRFGTTLTFFVSDRSGRYYDYLGSDRILPLEQPEHQWYQLAKHLPENQSYRITTGIDPERPGHLDIFIDHKVYDYENRFLGIIGVGLSVTKLKELIEHYQQRYQRYIYFVDRQGNVVLHGERHNDLAPLNSREGMRALAPKLLSEPSGSYSYLKNGLPVYLNARLIPEFDWYLIVEQHEHHAIKDISRTFIINIFISIVVTIIFMIVLRLTMGKYQRQLEKMASTDKLTGVINRQMLPILYKQLMGYLARSKAPVSLLIFDIDYFKLVNDQYGHNAGDDVLKCVAQRLGRQVRKQDIICRWGGEEFLVLLTDCTLQHASQIADNMRVAIRSQPIVTEDSAISITLSGGVTLIRDEEPLIQAVKRADEALYQAKQSGRDQIRQN